MILIDLNSASGRLGIPDPRIVLDALPHPVFVVNRDGRLAFSNIASEAYFQMGSAVLHRKHLKDLVPPDSPLTGLVERAREKSISVNEYAIRLDVLSTRKQQLVDIQVAPLAGSDGSVLVMLLHRHMAETIDRQLTHRHAARAMTGIASILAHEIKNPLAGIRGAAQLLETSLSNEDRVLTTLIRDEADRIVRLIDRMDTAGDALQMDKTPVNVHQVLHHVRQLAINGEARDIRITEEYDPSLPPVSGNRDQLIQIFLNLVKNAAEAIKSSGEGDTISLSSSFRPGMRLSVPGARQQINLPLEFSVRDNGPGVPLDLLSTIFDPFVTTKSSGTGLGLALVARLVDMHGGIIECQSYPGDTLFRILLPVFEED